MHRLPMILLYTSFGCRNCSCSPAIPCVRGWFVQSTQFSRGQGASCEEFANLDSSNVLVKKSVNEFCASASASPQRYSDSFSLTRLCSFSMTPGRNCANLVQKVPDVICSFRFKVLSQPPKRASIARLLRRGQGGTNTVRSALACSVANKAEAWPLRPRDVS